MSTTRSRVLMIALILSVLINLILIGGWVGRSMLASSHHRPMPDHLGWILRGLDEQERTALRPELRAHAREVFPLRREIRTAQKAFDEMAMQETVDKAALEAALTRLREASLAYQVSSHEQLVNILERLEPEDRNRVITYLNRRRPDDRQRQESPRPERD